MFEPLMSLMDYFNDDLTTLLVLSMSVVLLSMQDQKALGFHQTFLNCVLKMNEGLMGLE